MGHDLFPFSPPESRAARNIRRWRSFLRFTNALIIGFFTSFLLVYITFYSSSRRLQDWHLSSYVHLEHANFNETPLIDPKLATFLLNPPPESIVPNNPPPPSPSSQVSDTLSLEQIRDIVAPTRGFFSRDYSLGLGWNNVSGVYCHYVSATNYIFIGAVYHRDWSPSGRAPKSHLDYTFVRLCTRMRVPHVCDAFPISNRYPYTFILLSSTALYARTMQHWSIGVTL